MNKKMYVFTVLLVLIAGVSGGVISNSLFALPSTQAQQVERSKAALGQRWEYCVVIKSSRVTSSKGSLYSIIYFRDDGAHVAEIEESATERNGPSKAIAKLGDEGWEMVGEAPVEIRQGSLNALYFKRPKT